MKKLLFSFAIGVCSSVCIWAQSSIVAFPSSLGEVEVRNASFIPNELKDVTSLLYKSIVGDNIVAEYSGAYGLVGVCSFDANMTAYFPPKEFMETKTRYIGVNDNSQIIVSKVGKGDIGSDICILDSKMNLLKSVNINGETFFNDGIAHMFVQDGKIYLILWQYEKKKLNHWMGYILDANTLDVLRVEELSKSYKTKYTYSQKKKFLACVAPDESKGKYYLYNPLDNGADIKLYDREFNLVQSRYVHGNLDDPWVLSQDEKERKKIYKCGATRLITKGDYHVFIGDDGVMKYITMDVLSVQKITAFDNVTSQVRDAKLSLYSLSASKNDSISISDLMKDKKFKSKGIIDVNRDSVSIFVWYSKEQNTLKSDGLYIVNWDSKSNTFDIKSDIGQIPFSDNGNNFQRVLYNSGSIILFEHLSKADKSHVSYELWNVHGSEFSKYPILTKYIQTLNANQDLENFVCRVLPIQQRSLVAISKSQGVYCFLVRESLNKGLRSLTPIESDRPLYLEFYNKEGKLVEFVFPEKEYDIVEFGDLGIRKAYKSKVDVNVFQLDDESILFYLKRGGKHQWITLHPAAFAE